MKNTLLYLFISVGLNGSLKAQNNMTVETSPGGNEYLLYLPEGYDSSEEYPLILYLHGAQAVDNDISSSFGKGLPGAISRQNILSGYPFIMVAPHFKGPKGDNSIPWDNDKIEEVLIHVESIYDIDQNRIIGSGVSLGAKGIIDFALAFPDKLAGLVPISGNAFVEDICTINGVALWAFHGDSDGTIPINGTDDRPGQGNGRFGSQVIVDSLNACDIAPDFPAVLTVFKAKGHNGWDQVYNLSSGFPIYEWMENLEKGSSNQYAPLVNLGTEKSFITTSQTLQINSFAMDPDGDNLTLQYSWTQLSGPTLSLQNTSSPVLSMDMSTPGLYTFRLTVTDAQMNTSSDEISINILTSTTSPQVSGLQFFYDDNLIDNIDGNYVVDMSLYDDPEKINIAAVTANLNSRASVRFALDDNNNFFTRNDNTGYNMGGNNNKSFLPLDGGIYNISATAFADRNGIGPGVSFQSTIAFTSTPLPIELVSFSAKRERDEVVLKWTTAEEINHSHFEIYQGIDNIKEMTMVAQVSGEGNSSSLKHYEHRISPAPSCGKLFYQLKNVDFDGSSDVSKIITAGGTQAPCSLNIYPNPNINGKLVLESELLYEGMNINLISLDGQLVKSFRIDDANLNRVNLDIRDLSSGIYFVQAGANYEKLVIK